MKVHARHTKGSAAASLLLFNHLLGEKLPQNAVHCVIAAMSHLAGNHGRYDPSTPAINTTYPQHRRGHTGAVVQDVRNQGALSAARGAHVIAVTAQSKAHFKPRRK